VTESKTVRSLAVYCGSHSGRDPAHVAAAEELGREAARQGIRIVTGGGSVGLMGALADATLAAGGEVVGVIPRFLVDREVGHRGLTELVVVESMHERKAAIAALAGAFAALPGGIGTLEELFETWTWVQLGLHRKPCGLLNSGGYFDPLIDFLDRSVAEGFVAARHRALLQVAPDAEGLLALLAAAPAPPAAKWSGGADGEDAIERRG
jgi:uncharacterized protein (TIGR00730 family)